MSIWRNLKLTNSGILSSISSMVTDLLFLRNYTSSLINDNSGIKKFLCKWICSRSINPPNKRKKSFCYHIQFLEKYVNFRNASYSKKIGVLVHKSGYLGL